MKLIDYSAGHQPLQDIEIRVGNSSAELQRNPLCAWFPGTIGECFERITKPLAKERSELAFPIFVTVHII